MTEKIQPKFDDTQIKQRLKEERHKDQLRYEEVKKLFGAFDNQNIIARIAEET